MKCKNCGEWIFEPTPVSIGRVGVTDPFLVQRGLVRPRDMKMTVSRLDGEGFLCPKCRWSKVIAEVELAKRTIRIADLLPKKEDSGSGGEM